MVVTCKDCEYLGVTVSGDMFCMNGKSPKYGDFILEDQICEFHDSGKDKIDPDHYKTHEHECIDEMLAMFGIYAVMDFCKCNIWKYRYRAEHKGDYENDMKKSDWYMNKLMELQGRDETKIKVDSAEDLEK